MKWCPKCQTDKPPDEFYPRNSACKECKRRMSREFRARNIERYLAYEAERYQAMKNGSEFLGPDVW